MNDPIGLEHWNIGINLSQALNLCKGINLVKFLSYLVNNIAKSFCRECVQVFFELFCFVSDADNSSLET